MHSAILLYQFCPSVRLSVHPMPENEWTYRHVFEHSGRGIILVFEPYCRCKNPKGTQTQTLQRWRIRYRGWQNFANIALYLENGTR